MHSNNDSGTHNEEIRQFSQLDTEAALALDQSYHLAKGGRGVNCSIDNAIIRQGLRLENSGSYVRRRNSPRPGSPHSPRTPRADSPRRFSTPNAGLDEARRHSNPSIIIDTTNVEESTNIQETNTDLEAKEKRNTSSLSRSVFDFALSQSSMYDNLPVDSPKNSESPKDSESPQESCEDKSKRLDASKRIEEVAKDKPTPEGEIDYDQCCSICMEPFKTNPLTVSENGDVFHEVDGCCGCCVFLDKENEPRRRSFLGLSKPPPATVEVEPLDPWVEQLPCGHKFHKACLNQWFSACVGEKKLSFYEIIACRWC